MKKTFAINGTGRIGKCIIRVFFQNEKKYSNIILSKINTTFPNVNDLIHYIKYDSVHGIFNGKISAISEDKIQINDSIIDISFDREVLNLNWSGIDFVLECTGKMTSSVEAKKHIERGAKKVIISAPATGDLSEVSTIVYGINDENIELNDIISIGSCTTNCLAPVVKVIEENIGIESGFVTTIHSYTNGQNVLDSKHKDLRRSRSCGVSMIPTSTGAAKTIGLIIPSVEGKLDGTAVRVPTQNVSMIDCVFYLQNGTSVSEVNSLFEKMENKLKGGCLSTTKEPLVSIDFVSNENSCVVDLLETRVIKNKMLRVAAWYDNEWAFSMRMIDVLNFIII